jgi:hypothetical protein
MWIRCLLVHLFPFIIGCWQVELGAPWNSSALVGDGQLIGGSGKYSDRPTVTYVLLSDAAVCVYGKGRADYPGG